MVTTITSIGIRAVILTAIASAIFIFAAYQLNWLCFLLSPLALAIVFFYSLTKRFTWASHLFLGLALAIAPVGAWLATVQPPIDLSEQDPNQNSKRHRVSRPRQSHRGQSER